jgi:hypothetical protein
MTLAEEWGRMVALSGNRITSIPIEDAVGDLKMLSEEIYGVAELFFG